MDKKELVAILVLIGFVVGVLIGYISLNYPFWPDSMFIGVVGAIIGSLIGAIITK